MNEDEVKYEETRVQNALALRDCKTNAIIAFIFQAMRENNFFTPAETKLLDCLVEQQPLPTELLQENDVFVRRIVSSRGFYAASLIPRHLVEEICSENSGNRLFTHAFKEIVRKWEPIYSAQGKASQDSQSASELCVRLKESMGDENWTRVQNFIDNRELDLLVLRPLLVDMQKGFQTEGPNSYFTFPELAELIIDTRGAPNLISVVIKFCEILTTST